MISNTKSEVRTWTAVVVIEVGTRALEAIQEIVWRQARFRPCFDGTCVEFLQSHCPLLTMNAQAFSSMQKATMAFCTC